MVETLCSNLLTETYGYDEAGQSTHAPNPAGFALPRSRGFELGETVATRYEPPAVPLICRGKDRNASNLPTDHRFTGQISDASGLIFMNARYYDPVLVSFLSPDTVVPEPGQPEGYNRYAYANGNPLRFSDPSGHIPDEEICTLFEICGDGARLLFEKHFGASLTDLLFDTSTSWGDLIEWDSSKKAAMLVLLDLRDGGGGMGPALWGVMGSIAGKPVSFSQLDPAAAYDTTYIASIDSVDDLPIDWDYSSSYWPTTYVDISEWYLVSASSSVIGNGGQLLAGAATKLGLGGYAIKAAELLGQWGIPAVGLLSQAANLMDDFKLNPYGYQCSKTFCSAVTTYPAVRFRTDAPGWWYYSFMEPRARR